MGHVKWSAMALERGEVTLRGWDSGGRRAPLVLLHGLAGYAGEWCLTAHGLVDRFRVLALDQRGHGASSRRPADVSQHAFVDDVTAVIDELADGEPVTLVGQSMGAHTAMLTAAARPGAVDRLVMVEGGLGGEGSAAVERLAGRLASWPVPFPSREAAVSFFGGKTAAAHACAGGLESRHDGFWPRFDQDIMVAALTSVAARSRLQEWAVLTQPTMLVLGDHGSVDPDELARMRAARPDTEVALIANAGHDIHLEQPRALLRVLEGFL